MWDDIGYLVWLGTLLKYRNTADTSSTITCSLDINSGGYIDSVFILDPMIVWSHKSTSRHPEIMYRAYVGRRPWSKELCGGCLYETLVRRICLASFSPILWKELLTHSIEFFFCWLLQQWWKWALCVFSAQKFFTPCIGGKKLLFEFMFITEYIFRQKVLWTLTKSFKVKVRPIWAACQFHFSRFWDMWFCKA